MAAAPPIPEGFSYLQAHVDRLLADAPEYERNVFVIMRFLDTPPLRAIHAAIRAALKSKGLCPLRADDRVYHPELWGNLCTYMLGCSKAVAVFEDVELREFNPNVALELGFMLSAHKHCLILKEKRLPKPPTDIIGHLWREFDSFRPTETIAPQVGRWLIDIGWTPPATTAPKPVVRHLLREASAFHRVLETLDREFDLEIVFDEQAADVFADLASDVVAGSTIFREQSLLDDLAAEDSRMHRVLAERRSIAEAYLSKVVGPLSDLQLDSNARIRQAHDGVRELLDADSTIFALVEDAFAASGPEEEPMGRRPDYGTP